MLAAGFQDAGAWYAAVVYDFVEAESDFVDMAAEKLRMAHSENLGGQSQIEVEARSEMERDHLKIDSVVRSGK